MIELIARRRVAVHDRHLEQLQAKSAALLKQHGALSHGYGFYRAGPHKGEIFMSVVFPDSATQENAIQALSQQKDWRSVARALEKIAPLQESHLIEIQANE